MQPMQLTQHEGGYKYPPLKMGQDPAKHHIFPGEHLQGKIVDVQHTTFPARGNMGPQKAIVIGLQVNYAASFTGLVGGTFCITITNMMRDAFITAQYGINDFFGLKYEGRAPSKANPGQSYHKYTIEGQKTAESQFVAPPAEAMGQNAAPATAPLPPAAPGVPQAPATPQVPGAAPAAAAPQAPATPQVPGAPPVPGIAQSPGGYPAQPQAPATPQVPGVPAAPAAPAAPQVPGHQQLTPAPAPGQMPTY